MAGIDLSLDRVRLLYDLLPRYDRPTCHIAGTNGKGSVSAFLSSIFQAAIPPYKVGRYNSPHLVSVYDCITIDDVPVTPEKYAEIRDRVEMLNEEKNIGATSFEVLTLTALQIFQDLRVDVAVVEVGMGGRLDATNVIQDHCILISALTSVDLDHQAFLGNTVADIAREKAAIGRAGKPFVLGLQRHSSVNLVVQETCEKIGADLVPAIVPSIRPWNESTDGPRGAGSALTVEAFLPPDPQPIQVSLQCFPEPLQALLPLQGEHQLINLGTALSAISMLLADSGKYGHSSLNLKSRITLDTVHKGIQSTIWNGRLSFYEVPAALTQDSPRRQGSILVLADGAHNPASSATLSAYITSILTRVLPEESRATIVSSKPRSITLTYVLALSHSPPKTPRQTLSALLPPTLPIVPSHAAAQTEIKLNVALLRFTPPDGMPWVKSAPPSELQNVVASLCPQARTWVSLDDQSTEGQLQDALNWARGLHVDEEGRVREGLIVLAGSLYLVADFYRLLERTIS